MEHRRIVSRVNARVNLLDGARTHDLAAELARIAA
jgi:hypothetical protein